MIADTQQLDARPIRDAEVQRLQQQYPGVCAWYGHHTRQWWALLPPPRTRLIGGVPSLPALEGQIIRRLGLLR